jgi:hypothetical protein
MMMLIICICSLDRFNSHCVANMHVVMLDIKEISLPREFNSTFARLSTENKKHSEMCVNLSFCQVTSERVTIFIFIHHMAGAFGAKYMVCLIVRVNKVVR